jgi:hypothetical protein
MLPADQLLLLLLLQSQAGPHQMLPSLGVAAGS